MVAAVETMAYAGEVPWHGLGTKVSNDISIDDMLKESGLDWKVVPVPVFGEYNGQKITSDHQMLVRDSDSKVLTMITDKWNPVQNSEAFEFFRQFVEEGSMEMHTAGSLRDGQWVWCLAKVKESFELFGGASANGFALDGVTKQVILDGTEGSDTYTITLSEEIIGQSNIYVVDSGTGSIDTDRLDIRGGPVSYTHLTLPTIYSV